MYVGIDTKWQYINGSILYHFMILTKKLFIKENLFYFNGFCVNAVEFWVGIDKIYDKLEVKQEN